MASLDKLTKLSEPSIHGAQLVRETLKAAETALEQSQQDYHNICQLHPKLAFLISDNQMQTQVCQTLERNLRQSLEQDLDAEVKRRRSQANDLHRDMSMVLELLKSREVVEREFQKPAHLQDKETMPHTLYDHIDQDSVDGLENRLKEHLDELEEIAERDREHCSDALKRISEVELGPSEDISVTWEGVRAIGGLVEKSEEAVREMRLDLESVDHHCGQLKDTIRDLEVSGQQNGEGLLSMDDYEVLVRDTDEIPVIVGDLKQALEGVRGRLEETNVRRLQYRAFYEDSQRQFQSIRRVSEITQEYVERVRESQMQFGQLMERVDKGLEDLWGLISWYRNFHSAYDSLISEVYRRRQAQRALMGVVEEMRERLEGMYREEIGLREGFVERSGPFLPSDLCGFIQDPPVRFSVEELKEEGLESVQSHETTTTTNAEQQQFSPLV